MRRSRVAVVGFLTTVACGSSSATPPIVTDGGATYEGASPSDAGDAGTSSGTSGADASSGPPVDSGSASSADSGSSDATASETGVAGEAGSVGCDRAGLQAAVTDYLAAVQAADTKLMPLAPSATYTEVTQSGTTTTLGKGLWQSALSVTFSRSLLDVTSCETFTEVFITGGTHPYVLGTRLTISNGAISAIYTLVTQNGDWNFDATAYETCDKSEDWSVLPSSAQSSRDQLIANGQAYFDYFNTNMGTVPWGTPCYRLEGGKSCTPAIDSSSMTCDIGVPKGITFAMPHWVVDVDLGTAEGMTLFGGANGLPDSHMFRAPNGKLRYVHTLTICTVANCGM
jgi:hypothetical protein